MKNNAILCGIALSLVACGGGGGGHNANNGGFQQPREPELNVSINPSAISPNPSGLGYERLSSDARALVTVYARQGNTPVENGESELKVSLNQAIGTTNGRIYCFEIGNEACVKTVKNAKGEDIEVPNPLGKVQLDLAAGRGMFAVTAENGKAGEIGINITISGPDNASVSKDILIPVKYISSGVAHQIKISASDILRIDEVSNISVSITDEAGNPVSNPDVNNLIVTANNLPGTTLGLNGTTGISVSGKSDNGRSTLSVLPTQKGFLTITAQSDKDNNIDNGIQNLIAGSKTIRVTDEDVPVTPDVVITGGKLPNGIVGVKYDEFTISVSGPSSDFAIESGNFPPGLIFNKGTISGTPTLAGEYTFKVKATGVNNSESTKELTIKILEGGFKFSIPAFDPITPTKNLDPNQPDTCINVGQLLSIVPVEGYSLKPPFKWTMDAGDVQTALGKNKAKRAVTANGIKLINLDFTVTDDTQSVALNGRVCPSAPAEVFNGHAIILNATDANGFTHESILPLAINLKVVPYTPPTEDKEEDKINELTLPSGTLNTPYGQTIPGTKSSTISSGKLPDGLSFANGVVSGTPKEKGVFTFTVVEGKTTNKIILTIQ